MIKKLTKNQSGSMVVPVMLSVLILGIISFGSYYIWQHRNTPKPVAVTSNSKSTVASPVPKPSTTPPAAAPVQATISGKLAYPSSSNPAQKVCAVDTTTKKETCVETQSGDNTYELKVEPGSYYVYASLLQKQGDVTPAYKAYDDQYSVCGNAASCPASGHTEYVTITVTAGETKSGVDPTDWYNT